MENLEIKTGYTGTEKRKDSVTREEVSFIIASCAGRASKLYWLSALVKQGKISETRAGQILIEQGLY
jgi:hypothetical protein